MSVYFPSSIISFSQSYGILVLPIAADFVTRAVFKRAGIGKAQFAGLIAGVAVSYALANKTSSTIVLTGAIAYFIYKSKVWKPSTQANIPPDQLSIEDLEQTEAGLAGLIDQFTFTSDRKLVATDEDFNKQYDDLVTEVKPETDRLRNLLWGNTLVKKNTLTLLQNCQSFLFRIYSRLEEQTKDLERDPKARFAKMAELYRDPSFDPHNTFGRAWGILLHSYRQIRCGSLVFSLPNLENPPEGEKTYTLLGVLWPDYCALFINGKGSEKQMNLTYNETIDRLDGLLKILYPQNPYNVKDEQLFPGEYNNPTNPFWIAYPAKK